MSDKTVTDPWDFLMEVARAFAIVGQTEILSGVWRGGKRCLSCGHGWLDTEEEYHSGRCPIRPGQKNPYAGLVEVLGEAMTDLVIAADNMDHAAKTDGRWEGCGARLRARVEDCRAALAKAEGRS